MAILHNDLIQLIHKWNNDKKTTIHLQHYKTCKTLHNYVSKDNLVMLLASASSQGWRLLSSRPTSRAHDRSRCQRDPTGRKSRLEDRGGERGEMRKKIVAKIKEEEKEERGKQRGAMRERSRDDSWAMREGSRDDSWAMREGSRDESWAMRERSRVERLVLRERWEGRLSNKCVALIEGKMWERRDEGRKENRRLWKKNTLLFYTQNPRPSRDSGVIIIPKKRALSIQNGNPIMANTRPSQSAYFVSVCRSRNSLEFDQINTTSWQSVVDGPKQ